MLPQSHSSCSARTSPFFPRENEGGMVPRKYNVKLTYSLLKMSKLKSFYTWESGTFWKSFTKFAALKESKYSNFDIFNNEQAWRGWNQRLKSTSPAPIKNIYKEESRVQSRDWGPNQISHEIYENQFEVVTPLHQFPHSVASNHLKSLLDFRHSLVIRRRHMMWTEVVDHKPSINRITIRIKN